MAKQTFTTGQVLTSAQMTALQLNDYNQTVSAKVASYVLVAADAGTRITMSNAGATTITVNTSLFAAGDTLFITNIGAGASTITAGTATVSTASSLVLAQYDSGRLYFTSTGVAIWEKYAGASSGAASALVLVKARTSFSAVANTGTTFDALFTSTYKNYIVIIDQLLTSSGSANDLKLNFRSGGSTVGSIYGYMFQTQYTGTTSNLGMAATTFATLLSGDNDKSACTINFEETVSGTARVYWTGYSSNKNGPVYGAANAGATANGFQLAITTGTMTGYATVYGLVES